MKHEQELADGDVAPGFLAEEQRAKLVALAQATRDKAELPAGYHVAVVVTNADGDWCGVSSTADDTYTAALLLAALQGSAFRRHTP